MVIPPQASVAIGAVQFATPVAPVAFTVILLGHPLNTGVCAVGHGSVFATVTTKLQAAVLPFASVAIKLTVVFPMGKIVPETLLPTKVAAPQLSLALGVCHIATAPLIAGFVTPKKFTGQLLIVGGVTSVKQGSVVDRKSVV